MGNSAYCHRSAFVARRIAGSLQIGTVDESAQSPIGGIKQVGIRVLPAWLLSENQPLESAEAFGEDPMISSDDLYRWNSRFQERPMSILTLAFLPRVSLVSWPRDSIYSDLLP